MPKPKNSFAKMSLSIAHKTGVPARAVQDVLASYFNLLKQYVLEESLRVQAPKLGVFSKRRHKTKKIRSPKTGELIQTREITRIGFKAAALTRKAEPPHV